MLLVLGFQQETTASYIAAKMCPGRCKNQPMNGLGRTKLSFNSDGSAHLVVHCTCTRDVANTEIFLKARSRFWKPNFPNHITSRAVFTINCNACQLSFGLNQLGSYMWLRGGLSDKSALFRFVCDKSALFKQYCETQPPASIG